MAKRYNIILTGFKSREAYMSVGKYLLSLSSDKDPEKLKAFLQGLPKKLYKDLEDTNARRVGRKFIELGATIKVEESQNIPFEEVKPHISSVKEETASGEKEGVSLDIPIIKSNNMSYSSATPKNSPLRMYIPFLVMILLFMLIMSFSQFISTTKPSNPSVVSRPLPVVNKPSQKPAKSTHKVQQKAPDRRPFVPKKLDMASSLVLAEIKKGVHGDRTAALLEEARLNMINNDLNKAISTFSKLIGDKKKEEAFCMKAANIYFNNDRLEDAKSFYHRALVLNPANKEADGMIRKINLRIIEESMKK